MTASVGDDDQSLSLDTRVTFLLSLRLLGLNSNNHFSFTRTVSVRHTSNSCAYDNE